MRHFTKLSAILLATIIAIPFTAQASEDLFNKVYGGIQTVDGNIGFKLGGDYMFTDEYYATADFTSYSYNEEILGIDYSYGSSLIFGGAGMLFPLESNDVFQSLTAYAEGGLAIYTVEVLGISASTTALYLGGGARGYVNEQFWVDGSLSIVTASGSDISLKVEGGYVINEQFDVSAILDSGSLGTLAFGVLANYTF